MPVELRRSVLILNFKNTSDVESCSSYRWTWMSHRIKLQERVVETRLRLELTISEELYGFLLRKNTLDVMFCFVNGQQRTVNKGSEEERKIVARGTGKVMVHRLETLAL